MEQPLPGCLMLKLPFGECESMTINKILLKVIMEPQKFCHIETTASTDRLPVQKKKSTS